MPILNDNNTTVEDTKLEVDAAHGVLANDTGQVEVVEGWQRTTQGGQVYFNPDGSYLYVAAAGFSGTDSVTYTALDASDNESTGTLTIDVTAAAHAPFVTAGTQLSQRHLIVTGFDQAGNGLVTTGHAIAPLSGGGYVVAVSYLDHAPGSITQLRTYDANHNLVGSAFEMGFVRDLRVVALPNGGYVAAWGTQDLNGRTVQVQVFDADGNSVAGPNIIDVPGPLDGVGAAGLLPGGGFVVLLVGTGGNYTQVFTAAGTPVGSAAPIGTEGVWSNPVVLPNGDIVALRIENDEALYVQRFHANGTPTAPGELLLPDGGTEDILTAKITPMPGGGFAASWVTVLVDNPLRVRSHVQLVDAGGNLVGILATRDLDATTAFSALVGDVTPLANGGFVVYFRGEIDQNDNIIHTAQVYDSAGHAVGGLITFAEHPPSGIVRLIALTDGGFIAMAENELNLDEPLPDVTDALQVFDNNGIRVGEIRLEDDNDGVNISRTGFQRLPDGRIVVRQIEETGATGTYRTVVQILDLSNGTSTPLVETSITFNDDASATIPISVFVPDPDGSDIVERIDVAGVPAGWMLSHPSSTAVLVGGVWQVSGSGIAQGGAIGLLLTPPPDTTGSATLTVTAHTREMANGDTSVSVPVNLDLTFVAENRANGTVIADLDDGSGSTFTLVDGAGGRFAVSGSDLVVANGVALDFELAKSHAVTVRITESGGSSLLKTLVVGVTNVTGSPTDDAFNAPAGTASQFEGGGGTDTMTFGFKLTEATVTYSGTAVIIDGPGGSHTALAGFERFVFTDGTVNNNDGSPLIDDLFYYSQNHDVWNAHVDADVHYNVTGWKEGRDPSAFFDLSIYLSANPDVAGTGVNPLTHYDTTGWKEGRVPSLTFDGRAYLDANPDVKAANIDPLWHFLAIGASEGRQPVAPTELIGPNGFDFGYYLAGNPDVAAAGIDPFWHFQTTGWKEGRDPNALFDVDGYLAAYTDVAAANINPLDHYNTHGWREGRDPSLGFDTASYLAANPDVAAAHVNPLTHFLSTGRHEGRSAIADGIWS
jgi:hypothetical protein